PLSHIFERMAGLYSMLAAGVTIAYAQGLDSVGADADEVRPTVLNAVPRLYQKIHARVLDRGTQRPLYAQRLLHWGLARGMAGAIPTRGPNVMLGYCRNPDATGAGIVGGWFHGGDIGRCDPDGYLVITGRL